ncbi:hypothetical protein BDQ17DRAFT_1339503 [Cyathus striatus]|nr:hypothetical protein BDQ17DRAFT_1339503 [Cyathus striatus]
MSSNDMWTNGVSGGGTFDQMPPIPTLAPTRPLSNPQDPTPNPALNLPIHCLHRIRYSPHRVLASSPRMVVNEEARARRTGGVLRFLEGFEVPDVAYLRTATFIAVIRAVLEGEAIELEIGCRTVHGGSSGVGLRGREEEDGVDGGGAVNRVLRHRWCFAKIE